MTEERHVAEQTPIEGAGPKYVSTSEKAWKLEEGIISQSIPAVRKV